MRKSESPSAYEAQRRRHWAARAAIGALLALFAALSYTAARTKSATYDEPLHAVGGFIELRYHDYRIDAENPALFGMWSALPHNRGDLSVDTRSRAFQDSVTRAGAQWPF